MTTSIRLGPGAFRLVLASTVFLSHASRLNLGRAAVLLFFILSGYWVTRLFDQRSDPSVWPYLRDRILRVWPLLAVVAVAVELAFAVAGQPSPGSMPSTVALLGLATRHGDIIGTTWSLDIEMQFYIALPLVVLALARLPRVAQPAILAGALLIVTAAGAFLLSRDVVTVLAYAPAFAAGAFIWRSRWSPGGGTALWSLIAYFALTATLAAIPALSWTVVKSGTLPWWFDLSQLATCALLVPFVAWNVNQRSRSIDRLLGNLSYPFYLVHYPLIAATAGLLSSAAENKVLAACLSIAATLVIYTLVDRPLERIRKGQSAPRSDLPEGAALPVVP